MGFITAAAPFFLGACTAIQPSRTDFLSSYEGFEQASDMDDAIVHKGDVSKLARYNKVIIKDVKVLLPKTEEAGEVTKEEIAQLQSTFKRILQEEFGKHFTVVNSRSSTAMELRAAIVDVKAGDPALYVIGHAPFIGYASTAAGFVTGTSFGSGSATIQGELLDSRSRRRIYAMIDRRPGNQLDIVEGLKRWGHVEKSMRTWCQKVAKQTAEAKAEAIAATKAGS